MLWADWDGMFFNKIFDDTLNTIHFNFQTITRTWRSSWSPHKSSCSSTIFLADSTTDSLQKPNSIDFNDAISPTSNGISFSWLKQSRQSSWRTGKWDMYLHLLCLHVMNFRAQYFLPILQFFIIGIYCWLTLISMIEECYFFFKSKANILFSLLNLITNSYFIKRLKKVKLLILLSSVGLREVT